jgi:hypothetical protein
LAISEKYKLLLLLIERLLLLLFLLFGALGCCCCCCCRRPRRQPHRSTMFSTQLGGTSLERSLKTEQQQPTTGKQTANVSKRVWAVVELLTLYSLLYS